MQKVLIILPMGLWAALAGGAVGVVITYYQSGEWRNWGRMVSELIPAMAFSAAIAERLLPLESEFTCFGISLFVGAIAGFALDYWRQIGRFFVHNAFAKLSSVFTGRELPPADFSAVKQPENVDTPPKEEPKVETPPVVAPKVVDLPPRNQTRNQQKRKRKRR